MLMMNGSPTISVIAFDVLVYGVGFRTARAMRTGIYAERCAKPYAEHE